jgi:hypothetical protein
MPAGVGVKTWLSVNVGGVERVAAGKLPQKMLPSANTIELSSLMFAAVWHTRFLLLHIFIFTYTNRYVEYVKYIKYIHEF